VFEKIYFLLNEKKYVRILFLKKKQWLTRGIQALIAGDFSPGHGSKAEEQKCGQAIHLVAAVM
jgi:hypothetical protein